MVRGFLLAVVGLTLTATAVSAAQDYTREPTVVAGTEITRPAGAPAVLAQEADPGDRIPITGGDIAGLVLVGVGSIAAGTALKRRASRHA